MTFIESFRYILMLFFVLFNVGFVRYVSEISDLFLVVFLSDLRWILYDIQYVGNFRCIYQKLSIYFATAFYPIFIPKIFDIYIYIGNFRCILQLNLLTGL